MLTKIQDWLWHHYLTFQIATMAQECSMVCDVWKEVREVFSMNWDNCVTYSSDNTNSMTGQCNSLLPKIRSTQGD